MKFRMEHVLPTDPNRAWNVIMSEEFARQSYAHSGTIREVLSEEERNGLTFMKLQSSWKNLFLLWLQGFLVQHSCLGYRNK